jgi:hypothetical protein
MSMPALALVPSVPAQEPNEPVRDEAVGWLRRQIRWEARLAELRRSSSCEVERDTSP